MTDRAMADSPSSVSGSWRVLRPSRSSNGEVHVETGPAPPVDRLAHEGQQHSPARGDLPGHDLEEEGVVGGEEGMVVAQGELELPVVVLAVHRFETETGPGSGGHDLVDGPAGIDGGAGPVHIRPRSVDRLPATVAVGLEQERLQLDADHRGHSLALPTSDRVDEDVAGGERHRHPTPDDVGDDHGGAVLPPGTHRRLVEPGVAVGQTLPEEPAIVGGHLPIETQREQRDAVGRPARGLLWREVLATGETEMVGPEQPQPVEFDGHRNLIVDGPPTWTQGRGDDYLVRRWRTHSSPTGWPGRR